MKFSLKEFAGLRSGLKVEADCRFSDVAIHLSFHVCGDLRGLVGLDEPVQCVRRTHLWQSTCFEFFFGLKKLPHYIEWNIAPSGAWHKMNFDNYRKESSGSIKVAPPQLQVQRQYSVASDSSAPTALPGTSTMDCSYQQTITEFYLSAQFPEIAPKLEEEVLIGQPACILAFADATRSEPILTYWAPQHGATLDFHDRTQWQIFA